MTVDVEQELSVLYWETPLMRRLCSKLEVQLWFWKNTSLDRSKVSTTLVVLFSVCDRCCTREIAVPWNDDCELVELVL